MSAYRCSQIIGTSLPNTSLSARKTAEYMIPDTLAKWQWPRRINPYYEEVRKDTTAWMHNLKPFDADTQKAFDSCNFTLLAALGNPTQDKERYWTCAANMLVFFTFDEYSDVRTADGVKELKDIMMDALRNPQKARPAEENILGEMTRQFWERAIHTATSIAQERFIKETDEYTSAVIEEAADRETGRRRTVEEYLSLRRLTVGAVPSYIGLQLHMNIPDDIYYHPVVIKLVGWVTELIILGNDMCSYNREKARGDSHNIISVLTYNRNITEDEAMKWVADYHRTIVDDVLRCLEEELPWKLGTGSEIALYIDGLLNWVRAENSWSFESERYFGKKGLDIKESRRIDLIS